MRWTHGLPVVLVLFLAAPALTALPDAVAEPGPTAHPGAVAEPAAAASITLYADDHSFDAPERMPRLVTVRFVNRGAEMHHAQLIRLREGRTVEDLGAAMAAGTMPDFVSWVGGPGAVPPGGETTVTLQLRPGTYYWLCLVHSPDDDAPHVQKGMVRPVEVEGRMPGRLPRADVTVRMTDYDFLFSQPLRSGSQVLRVVNHAAQPHELILIRLMPGKSLEDVLQWVMGGMEGPPPGMPIGGMQALDNGLAGNLHVELEPGRYGAICFIPDASDMRPHFLHGMMMEFDVE